MHPKIHLFIVLWMSNLIKLHHLHNLFESQDCKSLQNFSSNLLSVDAYANHLCLTWIWVQFMHPSCIQFVIVWKYHPSIHTNISFESWIIQSCIWKCDNYSYSLSFHLCIQSQMEVFSQDMKIWLCIHSLI